MLNPQIAYQIDARTLLGSLVNADQSDLREIRSEFARYLSTRAAREATGWQDAWNRFTGSTSERMGGQIRYTPLRCKDCHGKGFDTRHVARNFARTGSPHVCGTCRGTRRGTPETLRARYIPVPATDETAIEPTAETGENA